MTKKLILISFLAFGIVILAWCGNKDLNTDSDYKDLTWDTEIIDTIDNIVNDIVEDEVTSEVYDPGTQEAVDLMNSDLWTEEEPVGDTVWMANPASVNCVEKWWELEIRDWNGWQYWICKFSDWTECEEWEFFRGECTH